jgi:hypothetical protein
LDLALIFATTNLKETNLLLVILKFFSLLQIVLCSHKEEFYDLSEFHCFLINVSYSHEVTYRRTEDSVGRDGPKDIDKLDNGID